MINLVRIDKETKEILSKKEYTFINVFQLFVDIFFKDLTEFYIEDTQGGKKYKLVEVKKDY